MALDTRELLARLIQCEAGGEGIAGMQAVATVIMNRARAEEGEFSRVSNGGDVQAVIKQTCQFVCMKESVGGKYNPQNVYNMTPTDENYEVADWALAGGKLPGVDDSLFFFNPYSSTCPPNFPTTVGALYTRVGDHCFYAPTEKYKDT